MFMQYVCVSCVYVILNLHLQLQHFMYNTEHKKLNENFEAKCVSKGVYPHPSPPVQQVDGKPSSETRILPDEGRHIKAYSL